jgi:predicted acyl esterase
MTLVAVVSLAETEQPDATRIDFQLSVRIPMRDGVRLCATAYAPRQQAAPAPAYLSLRHTLVRRTTTLSALFVPFGKNRRIRRAAG